MKKSIYLLALLAVVMLTACNDEDDTENTQTLKATVNARAVNGDNAVFSQGETTFELDYTDNTIQISGDYKDSKGNLASMSTAAMTMTSAASHTYTFTSSDAYHVNGCLDMSTGVIWYTFTDANGCSVYCSTHLYFAYATTTVTDADASIETQDIDYMIGIDSKGQTCDLYILNFMPDTRQGHITQEFWYKELTLTPTATGYTVTAASAKCDYSSRFDITDFNAVIDSQARRITGSYKVGETTYAISGDLFRQLN